MDTDPRSVISEKLWRIREGEPPRVLDLFSGCGGIFLGFHRAGCTSVGGVDIDPLASLSYAKNFHPSLNGVRFDKHASARDIGRTDPFELLKSLGHRNPLESVDLVVGGPPCPAFARVGRAKLREIDRHPEAFRHDPRAKLYLPYLRFVEALAPVALVMENVPDVLNFAGHNLAEEICEALEAIGYQCAYTLLNAAAYGVPQMRERFFLIAIHELASSTPTFPRPTHAVELPSGYESSRQVALKSLRAEMLFTRYVPPPRAGAGLPSAVTAEEALCDLPPITAHLEGKDRRGARRFVSARAYRDDVAPSEYGQQMRRWPQFVSRGFVMDHVTRCLSERDYRLFRRMKPGDEYPEAYKLAEQLFHRALQDRKRRGTVSAAAKLDLRVSYVPPYDPHKFPNKWRKLEPNRPARTLMAHLGKDTYSHIHYDADQARVISVREAARLQSFPDGFLFAGTMNPAFRQIGNSVPPLLSHSLATTLLRTLRVGVEAEALASIDEDTALPRTATSF